MGQIAKFAKYQLATFRKAVLIYYLILLLFVLVSMALSGAYGLNMQGETSGTEVFIFVLGLNCFKSSFLFAQANNISRRSFFLATILALLGLSAVMTLVDFTLNKVVGSLQIGMYWQVYPPMNGAALLWSWAFFAVLASAGWLITMIYYRSNSPTKIVVSLSPVFLGTILSYTNGLTQGRLWDKIVTFLARVMGFSGQVPNPYPAILSFSVLVILIWALNYLLMYKTPVKT